MAAPTSHTGDYTKLRAGAMRMLNALAAFYPGGMTKRQVAGAAKMKSTGGTFNTYWGELKRGGFMVEDSGGMWRVTDEGFALLGTSAERLPGTLEARIGFWRKRLRAGAVRILDSLYDRHCSRIGPIPKVDLADVVEMTATGGTFNTYLGILRNNRLAEEVTHGYQLTAWLVDGE